ncbi:MAG: winged helix-turn-helix transcriptional regulator [DPANN group archaeon]|nr:winged helix-turn-helix transcriptional regulator [DPANN group archaeon]
MKQLIWYLFAGTQGGETRLRMICILKREPMNAHVLAKRMAMDYKTITHHIRVMEKNSVIYSSSKGSYGRIYFMTEIFRAHWDDLMEIKTKIEEKRRRRRRKLGKSI